MVDRWPQAWITGLTNIAYIPACAECFRIGFAYEGVIGFFSMTTSIIYHVCESLDAKFLGLDEGRWHHMDNVFSQSCLILALFVFVQAGRREKSRQVFITFFLCLVICLQFAKPWHFLNTLVPVLSAAITVVVLIRQRWTLLRYDLANTKVALVALVVAIICFAKGIDEKRDWRRIWHGCWHFMSGTFAYYTLKANQKHDKM